MKTKNMNKIFALLLACVMLTMTSCSVLEDLGIFDKQVPPSEPPEGDVSGGNGDGEQVEEHTHKPVYVKANDAAYFVLEEKTE